MRMLENLELLRKSQNWVGHNLVPSLPTWNKDLVVKITQKLGSRTLFMSFVTIKTWKYI